MVAFSFLLGFVFVFVFVNGINVDDNDVFKIRLLTLSDDVDDNS